MSVHLERALVLVGLRRPVQAEEELRRALAEQPNNSTAHRLLAWCLALQDRLPQAQAEAEEAVRLQPDSDMAHHSLGWIRIRQRRWTEAEKALQEAIRLDPRYPDHFFMLAHLFSQRRRWRDCEEAAREGLRLDPSHVNCANSLAQALIHLDRPNEAQTVLRMVMAKDPENEWAHITQGLFYQRGNRPEQSLYHYEEAARINPENTSVHECIEQLKRRPIAWSPMLGVLGYLLYKLITYLLMNN
jgi:Tfp pilus assembly protein PilF